MSAHVVQPICGCPECKGMRAFEDVTGPQAGVVENDIRHNEAVAERTGKPYVAPRNAQGNRLPEDSEARKAIPLVGGLLDYFPDALAAVAACSKFGNDKHNPGEPLHWSRDKSNDHHECIARHLIDRGGFDAQGIRHSTYLAWRALAALQVELEADRGLPISRGSA
jgi:hypothetical protein